MFPKASDKSGSANFARWILTVCRIAERVIRVRAGLCRNDSASGAASALRGPRNCHSAFFTATVGKGLRGGNCWTCVGGETHSVGCDSASGAASALRGPRNCHSAFFTATVGKGFRGGECWTCVGGKRTRWAAIRRAERRQPSEVRATAILSFSPPVGKGFRGGNCWICVRGKAHSVG